VRGKREQDAAPQLEKIPWWGKNILGVGQKYFRGQTSVWGRANYKKINNNSENFKGARLLPRGLRPWLPLVAACQDG